VKGFVPTPEAIVDTMVGKLFADRAPTAADQVLDPGCGEGEFIAGILRACSAQQWPVPNIVGIELDPARAACARKRFANVPQIDIRTTDFLQPLDDVFDFIIGNPPYVAITGLSSVERARYRASYRTATGRFDLYVLFFEQALRQLRPDGRLVFITPEKFLYVETARPLRVLCQRFDLEELDFLPETSFGDRVTYPLVTTMNAASARGATRIRHRSGRTTEARLTTGASWLPVVNGFVHHAHDLPVRLEDVTVRISCGVATGADSVFVIPSAEVPRALERFSHRTLAGRQILATGEIALTSSLLAPYDAEGRLLREQAIGSLLRYLGTPDRRARLEARSCVVNKPWYAFHDSFPIEDMSRPKLLCKDITETPFFVIDREGTIVPRHSVYYVVPEDANQLDALAEYLNSAAVRDWLLAHCQRAANGFLRMQSHVMRRIPVPVEFASAATVQRLRDAKQELQPA
jgi:adenine-specific DNA-methyltransferase